MRRMPFIITLTLLVGIAVGVIADRAPIAQQEGLKRTVVLITDKGQPLAYPVKE